MYIHTYMPTPRVLLAGLASGLAGDFALGLGDKLSM